MQLISSATPFYFNGVKVRCATPLHIDSDGGKSIPLNIQQSQDPDQDFVQRWNKLSGELKLNALRINLVHQAPISYYDAFHGDGRSVTSYCSPLRSRPKIATFVTNNLLLDEHVQVVGTVCVFRTNSSDHAQFFAYPSTTVNPLVQFLETHYQLRTYAGGDLDGPTR